MIHPHKLDRHDARIELDKAVSKNADLYFFATHPDSSIRAAVASLPTVPETHIDCFLAEDDTTVLLAILNNAVVDWSLAQRKVRLIFLLSHSYEGIRQRVAEIL